jgi:hypothetical protein
VEARRIKPAEEALSSAHGPPALMAVVDSMASSCRVVFARVGVESLEFIRVDGTHHPRREHTLKHAVDATCAVPGYRDLHERRTAPRGDHGLGDQA